MQCLYPIRIKSWPVPVACGRCPSCLVNRSRLWSGRLLLESLLHAQSSFWTLTYQVEPEKRSLDPRHLQLWLKRARRAFGSFRFYGSGEYGDRNNRPHYHVVLFGVPANHPDISGAWSGYTYSEIGSFPLDLRGPVIGPYRVQAGFTSSTPLVPEQTRYVAKYIQKKWQRQKESWLNGRHKEFARMSLDPGIGAGAVPRIAEIAATSGRGELLNRIRQAGKIYPLGRYLGSKLCEHLGYCPDAVLEARLANIHGEVLDAGVYEYYDMQARKRGQTINHLRGFNRVTESDL